MKIRKKKVATPAAAPQTAAAPRPSSQFKDYDAVIRPDMIAYHYWREWFRARDRNDWDFMYEMSAEGSPLREQLGPRDAFPEACRRRQPFVPGLRDGELRRIRLEGPDEAHLIRVSGLDDRSRRTLDAERWLTLRSVDGWRVHQVDEISIPRDQLVDGLTLDLFPATTRPEGFVGRSTVVAEAPLPGADAIAENATGARALAANPGNAAQPADGAASDEQPE